MVIVDNGHMIKEDAENGSISKILKFFKANKEEVLENKDKSGQPQYLKSFKSLPPRLVVFTDNFLGATHNNDQLVAIENEFDRLKSIYVGNKVKLIYNLVLICPI